MRPEILVLVTGFLFLQIFHFTQFPLVSPDSREYLLGATFSIFSSDFWVSTRAPIYPLFLKPFQGHLMAIIWVQLLMTSAAWIYLASSVSASLGGSLQQSVILRTLPWLIILGLGSTPSLTTWNSAVLSEALSIVFLLVGLGSALRLSSGSRQFRRGLWTLFWISVVGYAGIRDSHPYFILGITGVGFLLMVLRRVREGVCPKPWMIGAVGAGLLIFALSTQGAHHGKRHYFSLVDQIGYVILPNPEATQFFIERGMPYNEKVEFFRGKFHFVSDWSVFLPWLDHSGKSTYIAWLLRDWKTTFFTRPLKYESLFHTLGVTLHQYRGEEFTLRSSEKILQTLFFPLSKGLMLFWGVSIVILAWLLFKRERHPVFLSSLIFLILLYPQLVFIWVGNPQEMGRHSLLVNLQLRLACWFLILLAAQKLLSPQKESFYSNKN